MKLLEIKNLYSKKNKMHDWDHILRLKRRVNLLKKNYKNIDEDLLKFLVLFHGLKYYVMKKKKDFSEGYVRSLMRYNKKPIKIEEKVVFDANALDNVGNFGIKKALTYGRLIGRSVDNTKKYLKGEVKRVKFYTIQGKVRGEKGVKIMENWIDG
jgi:hypothetical protein